MRTKSEILIEVANEGFNAMTAYDEAERRYQAETNGETQNFNPQEINQVKKKKPKDNPFLVKDMIVENAINVIHGATGCGKSLFVLKIVDDITTGKDFLDKFPVKQTKCLLIDMEMTEDDCIVRIRDICSDDNNSIISYEKNWNIEDVKCLEWFNTLVKKEKIKFIVFDTLSKIHGTDENSNTLMTPIMIKLLSLCKELNITVLLLHHIGKGKDMSGLSKGRGATCIADNAASYLEVKSRKAIDPHGNKFISMDVTQLKNRRKESINAFRLAIKYDSVDKHTNFTYISEIEESINPIDKTREEIFKIVNEEPGISSPNIKAILKDTTDTTIRNAIKSLESEKKITVNRLKKPYRLYPSSEEIRVEELNF